MSDPLPWRVWVCLYTQPSYSGIQCGIDRVSRESANPNGWYEEIARQSSSPCLQIPRTDLVPVHSVPLTVERLPS